MTDKPNTRPWDTTEDDYDRAKAFLLARYPDMERDMAFYANVMDRGAAVAFAIAKVLHELCFRFCQIHICTPRWVKRAAYFGCYFAAGWAVATGVMWLVTSLFVR
jgi:hypothetical protein